MKVVDKYYYRSIAYLRSEKIKRAGGAKQYAQTKGCYCGIPLSDDVGQLIYDKIQSGEPFCAGRLGAFELLNMRANEFGDFIGQKHTNDVHFAYLCNNAGFFPNDITLQEKFTALMKEACVQVDLLGVWFKPFEDYYINKHMKRMEKEMRITWLANIEPWVGNFPWSAALAGKKVLVIHPFESTIKSQYAKRALLFPDTNILPEFELQTLKAVQTIAGETDERFATWFDALDWMHQEAMKIDFDVAIIGCGAYGFPLAAKLKQSGKQAIHMGGATQLLFGIKGKRWVDNPNATVKPYLNDAWVYPRDEDTPKRANEVEGACYW